MSGNPFSALSQAVELLRPRNIARLARHIELLSSSLRELRRTSETLGEKVIADAAATRKALGRDLADAQKELARVAKRQAASAEKHDEGIAAVRRQLATATDQLTTLGTTLAQMSQQFEAQARRSEQLVSAYNSDWDRREVVERALGMLSSPVTEAHIRRSVQEAIVREDPFPHAVIEGLLPGDVYDTLVGALPPRVFFEERAVNKQQLVVPFKFAPAYSRAVWERFKTLADAVIGPAVQVRFQQHVDVYMQRICPALEGERLAFNVSDGRIMLRRPGYVIPPHRDPKWGFITVLMNLARRGDPEQYGTQIYRLKQDREAPSPAPFWVDDSECELVGQVPFRRNTTLVFLNSAGAHGASIPPDAPPELERYQFPFRVGPEADDIRRIVELMPPDVRAQWVGAKTERLGLRDSY